jgi:hypothetical protein
LSKTQAKTIDSVKTKAIDGAPAELALVRTEIAKLELFTKQMSAQTEEGIKAAQSEMIPRCGYGGKVDGIRSTLTESAMRSCGEQIRGELATLRQRENNLAGGAIVLAAPVVAGGVSTDPAIQAINLAADASTAFWAWFWLILMLITLECARSLSLWAFIAEVEGKNVDRDRARADELAEIEHQNRLAAMRNQAPAPAAAELKSEPVPEPAPAPIAAKAPEPEPEPELTDAERRSRAGGLAMQQQARADKAAGADFVLVGDWSARDAALKMAAE